MSTDAYPVKVRAEIDPSLSRWMWLVKWLLAIPHYFLLFFLWAAFSVVWIVTLFAILFAGRHPRALFEFNVGVLRWTWRVLYYAWAGLGTDRYPPFTLQEVPDYPAGLEVDYGEQMSRGLVLVKWWLLAIPHYLLLGLFVGGSLKIGSRAADNADTEVGIIALLTFFAAVVLLFKGRYPQGIFDLVIGLNRWVLRVVGYVSLMTDQYPPMRLDQGGEDPSGYGAREAVAALPGAPSTDAPAPAAQPMVGRSGWSPLRVVGLAVGSVVLVGAFASALTGLALVIVEENLSDDEDFLMAPEEEFSVAGYAITSENLRLDADIDRIPDFLLDSVKVHATVVTDKPAFIGIAPTDDADRYLGGVAHSVFVKMADHRGDLVPEFRDVPGGAPSSPPESQSFWEAKAAGDGNQDLVWEPTSGDWTVVVMNNDATPSVAVGLSVGAKVPIFDAGVATLFVLAAAGFVIGLVLVVWAIVSAHGARSRVAAGG